MKRNYISIYKITYAYDRMQNIQNYNDHFSDKYFSTLKVMLFSKTPKLASWRNNAKLWIFL